MEKKAKKGLLIFLFLVLLAPLLQQCLQVFDSGQLHGYFSNAPDVQFSLPTWFSGAFQSGKNDFVNDHTGFRTDLIRIIDQLEFSCFRRTRACVLGKENCLFFSTYINAVYGNDYIGYPAIHTKLVQLKAIQDTLAHLGISFVLVYAPSKAEYFKEYIPDGWRNEHSPTNHDMMLRAGDSLGIPQIDFHSWFLSLKHKSKEALFTRQGIHWTEYGAYVAGDSLIRYLERTRSIQMRHPLWRDIEHTRMPRFSDGDIAADENLIFPIANDTFSYPSIYYSDDSTKKKPNAIFIGDSFIMNLVKNTLIENVFDKWQFWFYFRSLCNEVSYDGYPPNPKIAKYNWKGELGKADCIIMMYTTPGLGQLGNGFIEQAYNYYYPKKVADTTKVGEQ